MKNHLFEINNLHAGVDGKAILQGFNLAVEAGKVHVIMGPNGTGKSTLAKALAGHPAYEIEAGEILLRGENIVELEPEERAHRGLFIGFQYPIEIPGVTNSQFLHAAYNAKRKANNQPEMDETAFDELLEEKMKRMSISPEFKSRYVNQHFSGGEKKKNEILQMDILDPHVVFLDETDSGLDIDAIKIVANGINQSMHPERGLVLITHYQRFLNYVKPDYVHVMMKGKIILSGGPELAAELESKGYEWLTESTDQGAIA